METVEFDPDVSVVVPAWGDYAGPLLGEALDSLRAQDLQARIIVVDNASDPPLADIPGAEVVRLDQRLSVGEARNRGLAEVRSPYVIFWDADDLMLPGTIRFLRERMAAHPEAVLIAASILEGDPPVPHRWPRRWSYGFTRFPRAFAIAHCVWSLFPTTGSSILRTEAAQPGFGDADSGEDWVLGVSLAFRGRVMLEPRPGRIYRRHELSLWETNSSGRQLMANADAVRERIRSDGAAPRWLKLTLPLVAVLQAFVALVVRPVAERVRATRPIESSSE